MMGKNPRKELGPAGRIEDHSHRVEDASHHQQDQGRGGQPLGQLVEGYDYEPAHHHRQDHSEPLFDAGECHVLDDAGDRQRPYEGQGRGSPPAGKHDHCHRRVSACHQHQDHRVVDPLEASLPCVVPGDRVVEGAGGVESDQCQAEYDQAQQLGEVTRAARYENDQPDHGHDRRGAVQEPADGVGHLAEGDAFHAFSVRAAGFLTVSACPLTRLSSGT